MRSFSERLEAALRIRINKCTVSLTEEQVDRLVDLALERLARKVAEGVDVYEVGPSAEN